MRGNQVVHLLRPALNKEQLRDAFSVSDTNPLWMAITQEIMSERGYWQANEGSARDNNNPLALAAASGAVDAMENLLNNLEMSRTAANR